MKKCLVATLSLGLVLPAAASVNLVFGGGIFRDSGGNPVPDGSLVLVVADTAGDGLGSAPAPGAFLGGSGDDIVVAKFGTVSGGFISGPTGALTLSGAWDQGDPLSLVWFPTLTSTDLDAAVVAGTSYGILDTTVTTPPAGGAWRTPVDGTTQSSIAVNNRNQVFSPGDSGVADGTFADDISSPLMAGLTVIPEPASGLLSLFAFVFLGIRRKR